mmetsp:Transcript_3109/g.4646  ORF Transcript_3109/g.4646 Transcript_3109/m.4646 type:complete len:826 (-) Transcript_3109:191-2668(-)
MRYPRRFFSCSPSLLGFLGVVALAITPTDGRIRTITTLSRSRAPALSCHKSFLGRKIPPATTLGRELTRVRTQTEPIPLNGVPAEGIQRLTPPQPQVDGLSRALRTEMINVDSTLDESNLKALQNVIDMCLVDTQREAVMSVYRQNLTAEELHAMFEMTKMHLTRGSRRKLQVLLGRWNLSADERTAFDVLCDMRLEAKTQQILYRIAKMDLSLDIFTKLGNVASWLKNSNVTWSSDETRLLSEMLLTPVNISGTETTAWEEFGRQGETFDIERRIDGDQLEALVLAHSLKLNSQQFWALNKMVKYNLSFSDMEFMREIGDLAVHLELNDEQREILWQYSTMNLGPEVRNTLNLGCRILLEKGPEKVSAVRTASKLRLSRAEKEVFDRLADKRILEQAQSTELTNRYKDSSGMLTMRKLLITEFKTNMWESYNRLMDKATNMFPLWTILSALAGILRPQWFSWFDTNWFTGALAVLMMSMGVTLTVGDLVRVASQPIPIATGFFACYVIMPLLALGLAKAFSLSSALTAGLVLVGSLNGGQSSNLCTYIANGDVALSILMTLATTIGATFMIPIISTLVMGQSVKLDSVGIALSTVQVFLAPMAAGMALKRFVPKAVDAMMPLTPVIGVVATCLLVGSAVAQSATAILAEGIRLQLPVILLHALGAIAGYWAMRSIGEDEISSRTSGIETCMKSSALGFLLAKLHFPDYDVRVPAAVSVVWVALMGASIAVIWRALPLDQELLNARYNQTTTQQPPTWLAYKNHLLYYPLRKPLRKVKMGTKKVIEAAKTGIQNTMEDIRVIRETSKLLDSQTPPDGSPKGSVAS